MRATFSTKSRFSPAKEKAMRKRFMMKERERREFVPQP
jgi:hypothetical protein